jgi:hypothetical protein
VSERRIYAARLTVNGQRIDEIIIDSHYRVKHADINDLIILELCKELDGKIFEPSHQDKDWEFYMLDRIEYDHKFYRLIWCMQTHSLFIGIINCFRR